MDAYHRVVGHLVGRVSGASQVFLLSQPVPPTDAPTPRSTSPPRIIRTIKGLLEIDDEAEEGSEPAELPRHGIKRRRSQCDTSSESPGSSEEDEDDGETGQPCPRRRTLKITAALHRDDAAELLKEAPFDGGPRVWRNGERVGSRRHRLRIFMFRGWDEGPCPPLAMDATREMFDHGRMWWESG